LLKKELTTQILEKYEVAVYPAYLPKPEVLSELQYEGNIAPILNMNNHYSSMINGKDRVTKNPNPELYTKVSQLSDLASEITRLVMQKHLQVQAGDKDLIIGHEYAYELLANSKELYLQLNFFIIENIEMALNSVCNSKANKAISELIFAISYIYYRNIT
jgi:hypothetical protein